MAWKFNVAPQLTDVFNKHSQLAAGPSNIYLEHLSQTVNSCSQLKYYSALPQQIIHKE